MKYTLSILFIVILITFAGCQEKQEAASNLIDPTLNEIQNEFMNNQSKAFLEKATEVINTYPPAWPEPEPRQSTFLLLDAVLHDVYAQHRPPVQTFFKTRMKNAIEEIEKAEVTEGARIWKMYNHGFVVRTASVTIGFDLVRGKSVRVDDFLIGDNDMNRLIEQCDVLFISHYHGDHTEEWVVQAFLDKGKPVVSPPEVWKDKAFYNEVTHLERISHKIQILPVQNGTQELKVVVYPGHQSSNILNNVILVITPEGLSFSQMGDQSNGDDFEWIDEVAKNHKVDILMPNCWTTDIVRVAKGFDPAYIITGHENEMGHTIDHREPYWLTYQRRIGSDRFGGSEGIGYDHPLVLMTWGESFHYMR